MPLSPSRASSVLRIFIVAALALACVNGHSQPKVDYPLGAGDAIRIQVFQHPDLSIDTRVAEGGSITYPLIGPVALGGLSLAQAEQRIAQALQSGDFIRRPQVTISLLQVRANQISVLGLVNRPGRFPLESANTRLSDMLAAAGGVAQGSDDMVIVSGQRGGQPYRQLIDLPGIYLGEQPRDDIVLMGGDTIYVHRAPVFYIYGEAQRPGAFRVERAMTIMQALAQGGGPTGRGSESKLRLHRRAPDGSIQRTVPRLTDRVQPDDVIYVDERLF